MEIRRDIYEEAKDIRFIDSGYKTLFYLEDGKDVCVEDSSGKKNEYPCKRIDSCHLMVGKNVFHICEFAELMERCGNKYYPVETQIPPTCMTVLRSDPCQIIQVYRRENLYRPVKRFENKDDAQNFVSVWNCRYGIDKKQEAAMANASMLENWNCYLANPDNYTEDGKVIRPAE